MRGLICEIIIIVMLYLIKKFKIYIIALICIIILYISLKYAATYFIVSSVRNIIANESLQKQIALHMWKLIKALKFNCPVLTIVVSQTPGGHTVNGNHPLFQGLCLLDRRSFSFLTEKSKQYFTKKTFFC